MLDKIEHKVGEGVLQPTEQAMCRLDHKRSFLLENVKMDLRVKRTRRLLQQALDSLMVEKSLNDITINDITERAEVNRTTFYAHFQDKYDLLNYSVREWFNKKLLTRADDWTAFSPEKLQLAIEVTCEFLAGYAHCSPAADILHQEQKFALSAIQTELYDLLLRWMRLQGRGEDHETRARLVSWAIFGTALQESQSYQRTHGDVKGLSAKIYHLLLQLLGECLPAEV
jgi:AcrR family transcriptional regulator